MSHPETRRIEAEFSSRGYRVEDRWVKLSHFEKRSVDFYFVKENAKKLKLIFDPALKGAVDASLSPPQQAETALHADMHYPRPVGGQPSAGIGVTFKTVEELLDFVTTLEGAV